jgi:hypothetical protein
MKNFVIPILLVLGGAGAVAVVVKSNTPANAAAPAVTVTPVSTVSPVTGNSEVQELQKAFGELKKELETTKQSLADAQTTLLEKIGELAPAKAATCTCKSADDPNCTCKACDCAAKRAAAAPLVNDDTSPVPVRPGTVILAAPPAAACANGSCSTSYSTGTYYSRPRFFRRR